MDDRASSEQAAVEILEQLVQRAIECIDPTIDVEPYMTCVGQTLYEWWCQGQRGIECSYIDALRAVLCALPTLPGQPGPLLERFQ